MLEILSPLQIENDGLLARIHRDERRSHAIVAPVGAVIAHCVAAAGRFDLDDLGTEQAQQMRRIGTSHDVTEIRNADALEHLSHSFFSRQVILPSSPTLARARSNTGTPSMP